MLTTFVLAVSAMVTLLYVIRVLWAMLGNGQYFATLSLASFVVGLVMFNSKWHIKPKIEPNPSKIEPRK